MRNRCFEKAGVLGVHAAVISSGEPRVGFIIAKRVEKRATRRNRWKRRLRHLMRERIDTLPEHSLIVVQALGSAHHVSHADLARMLDEALAGAVRRAVKRAWVGALTNQTR